MPQREPGRSSQPRSPRRRSADAQLPPVPRGIWLRWEGLVYEVAVAGADKQAPPVKRILHGLSGQLLPGNIMAIMGPSGSGKTSLMKLLAGRRPPSLGRLDVNGVPMDVPSFRRASGFVAQTTVFLDTLTVRETVTFTAMLRLDRAVPVATKKARVEEVLHAVDLAKCAGSRIGNDLAGGISGGERRRLSIAVEVVHRPQCLLLDEPTSGLDATSAQMVGDALRRMSAADGTSSVCSIHQPRASLLAVFDVLLLLAEGRVVYNGPIGLAESGAALFPGLPGLPGLPPPPDWLRGVVGGVVAGPPSGVLGYFAQNGYVCPALENPADWLLDLVHGSESGGTADASAAAAKDVEASDVQAGRVARAERFAAMYTASPLARAAMQPPAVPPAPLPAAGRGAEHGLFPTSWWTQFTQIWRRTLLYKLREPAAVMTQFSTAVVMPLIVGGIFWNISLSQSAVMDRLAAVSFTVLMQAFMCIDQILLFPRERAVYLRDHATGLHSTSSFFIARSLAEMPFILTFAYICATISYWMFGFQRDGSKYLVFVIIIMVVTEAGAALLTSLGALSPDMETGNLLATLLIVILTLLDGFYRNLKDVPPWCRWVANFSFLGYGVQAAAVNEFRGLVFTCTAEEALTGCIPDGDAFLQRQSLDKTNIGANIGYIILLAVGSRFVAYLALRFLYTGQSFRERLAQP